MKKLYLFIILILGFECFINADKENINTMKTTNVPSKKIQQSVLKKVLKNGMTILVKVTKTIPKVSLQMWYNVGSKDESTGEKGIAHLIEHMIFKGTKILSESDINETVHKLSGVCNAFTSYDYTGYLFDMPSQNWKEILPIIADTMVNCCFKDDHLDSEMKAVIQELKMRRDNYESAIAWEMISAIFSDHPYHYPIIGYKQDLWSVHGKDLLEFYKKHYIPNNAALVVVGDVDPEEVFELAEQHFGHIEPNEHYAKQKFYWNEDIASKDITMYRDIQQPVMLATFVVPGSTAKQDDLLEITSYLLGAGKTSRLYKKIVEDLELATSLETFVWNLFDYSLLFIFVEPKKQELVDTIYKTISDEINAIATQGVTIDEVSQAIKKAQMKYYRLLESTQQQAYEIGKYYLATNDENYAFKLFDQPIELFQHGIAQICSTYMRPTVMNKGLLLPLPNTEKKEWKRLQTISDQEDKKILSVRQRTTPIEAASYALRVKPHEAKPFPFPKPMYFTLANGASVYVSKNSITPKISILMEFKAKHYYDPTEKQGLANFVSSMMLEGTKNFDAAALAQAFESRGMSLSIYPGGLHLSLLSDDFEIGLDLLREILTNSTFPENKIEKVRNQLLAEIKNFWDDPKQFIGQIVKEKIYNGHPYSKNSLGTVESISSITQNDLVEFYQKYITPVETAIAIVGDLRNYNVQEILEKKLGDWTGSQVKDMQYPAIAPIAPVEVKYPINRDQIVLCFAGVSIDRKHPDYDKLLLFDQIFGGGVLGSMASRLFELREQSGLFYTINGSLIAGVSEQPGMVVIKTIVSLDRLSEAEQAIKQTITTVIDTLSDKDLDQAKQAVINSLVDHFESNKNIAQVFLFLHKYNFPADYFDKRAQTLENISLQEVKDAARKILKNDKLLLVKVGREA